MPTFSPPSEHEGTFARGQVGRPERRFWSYYQAVPRGMTVIKTGGVYRTVPAPDQLQLEAADLITDPDGTQRRGYFLGGHIYAVTDTIALELIAAGYTVLGREGIYPSLTRYPSTSLYPREL